jgi:hypothetical protein
MSFGSSPRRAIATPRTLSGLVSSRTMSKRMLTSFGLLLSTRFSRAARAAADALDVGEDALELLLLVLFELVVHLRRRGVDLGLLIGLEHERALLVHPVR